MFKDHLGAKAAADLGDALEGPLGGFFSPDHESKSKIGQGLGGLVTLDDTENGYGAGTLTWQDATLVVWFIDGRNDFVWILGLCKLP